MYLGVPSQTVSDSHPKPDLRQVCFVGRADSAS